jgi:hypothetical protein
LAEAGFTDQAGRLQRVLESSLHGCYYDGSEAQAGGRTLVVRSHRQGGAPVTVRFLGVKSSDATAEPRPYALLQLKEVKMDRQGLLSLLGFLFPILRGPGTGYARVRIEAGAALLDIVCQYAEWWEDEAPEA